MCTPRILFDNEFEWVVKKVVNAASCGRRDAIDAVRGAIAKMEAHFASASTPTTTRRGL